MVFGTKFITGCSVMIQVVTGMECQNTNRTFDYISPRITYPEIVFLKLFKIF